MFEPIKLHWAGQDYSLPADEVLRTIADVEEILTLGELYVFQAQRKTVPLAKLSLAYATVLRHAGARVSGDDIFAGLFRDGDLQAKALQAIAVLQLLMLPPEQLRGDGAAAGKAAAAARRAGSSRKSTSS